jgi:signal transduction histidine kinase
VEAVSAGAALQVTVNAPDTLPTIPAAIEVAAFRIVQEAVNNVIRHAQAKQCTLDIHVASGECEELHICIEDDGVGLSTEFKNGVGLHSIRERAAEVSGRCEFGNREPHGTSVRLALPLSSNS